MAQEHTAAIILASGSQVVTLREVSETTGGLVHPPGTVGVIVRALDENGRHYRVRFADSLEVSLERKDIALRRDYTRNTLARQSEESADDYRPYIIYRCIVGSRAYGLEHDQSDTDYRGFFLPPADKHWSLYGVPEQLEHANGDECYWEIGKFMRLALKANPTILECLYTPLVEHSTPAARELLEIRDIFLSRLVYQTYSGYVISQFKKMHMRLHKNEEISWKHAMHLLRLLYCGIEVLQRHTLIVDVQEHREELLAVRRGEVPWEMLEQRRIALHNRFEKAYAATTLPERPNYDAANDYLIRVRRSMVL